MYELIENEINNYKKNHEGDVYRLKTKYDIASCIEYSIENDHTDQLHRIIFLLYDHLAGILKYVLRNIDFVKTYRYSENLKFLLSQKYNLCLESTLFSCDEYEFYCYLITISNGSLSYDYFSCNGNFYYVDTEIWFLLKYYNDNIRLHKTIRGDTVKFFISGVDSETRFFEHFEEVVQDLIVDSKSKIVNL